MVRQANAPDTEPEQSKFELPSEKEHLFQVVDYWNDKNDNDVVIVKLEVIGGDEEGRTILNRINLDDSKKSFYFARMFLKAIGEDYKGSFEIDENNWIGKQLYAEVIHNGNYANIKEYNFDKLVNNNKVDNRVVDNSTSEEIAWDE